MTKAVGMRVRDELSGAPLVSNLVCRVYALRKLDGLIGTKFALDFREGAMMATFFSFSSSKTCALYFNSRCLPMAGSLH